MFVKQILVFRGKVEEEKQHKGQEGEGKGRKGV